jgi:hypothetical protein
VSIGGSISDEPDYLSYGFYATIIKDFDEKNWTLTGGYGYSHDTAGRCGADGACTPFAVFARDLQRGSFDLGVAWVVDRASLASLTTDVVLENGDQSKVYRYIPMFAPNVAGSVPNGASADYVNANRLPERPLEQLPLERHRFALTLRYAHRYDGSTLRLEERFYDDDWGLVASSTDARWIFDLGRRFAYGRTPEFTCRSRSASGKKRTSRARAARTRTRGTSPFSARATASSGCPARARPRRAVRTRTVLPACPAALRKRKARRRAGAKAAKRRLRRRPPRPRWARTCTGGSGSRGRST